MARRKGSLESIAAVVPKVYPTGEPDEARALRIFGVWSKVVSERVGRNAAPVRYARGVLTVHTVTSAWANVLQLESMQLLARLRARLPGIPLQRLSFRVGHLPEPPEAVRREPEPTPLLPLSEMPEALARELARIGDDTLRDKLTRAAAVSLAEPRKRKRDPKR
jgi:hypothetical protein